VVPGKLDSTSFSPWISEAIGVDPISRYSIEIQITHTHPKSSKASLLFQTSPRFGSIYPYQQTCTNQDTNTFWTIEIEVHTHDPRPAGSLDFRHHSSSMVGLLYLTFSHTRDIHTVDYPF
jgi:hypothetical protein